MVGISEYRFTLFIIKYKNDKFEKFTELVSWKSIAVMQNIEKIECIDSETGLDGILVIYQSTVSNEVFVYNNQEKNFIKINDFKPMRNYSSLLRKPGYQTKTLDNIIVSCAFVSNFIITKFNKVKKELEEHEGF